MGALDTVLHRYDAVLLVNAANALFAFLPRLRGAKVALNVDGIERQRAKWGLAGRLWYTLGERLSLVFPNEIVADAQVIADYYRERYGRETALIAYGATLLERDPPPDLARHGLPDIQPGRYLLYVSRLEPENQADLVIRAYADVPGDVPLLIVGDAPYAAEYKAHLARLAAADPRVRMVGGMYGEAYTDLQRAAMAYIQATSVGGTHPALIESMAAGNLVLAFGTPENREVTAGTALIFDDQAQLTDALTRVVEAPDSPEHQALRAAARARAEVDLLVARHRRPVRGAPDCPSPTIRRMLSLTATSASALRTHDRRRPGRLVRRQPSWVRVFSCIHRVGQHVSGRLTSACLPSPAARHSTQPAAVNASAPSRDRPTQGWFVHE